MQFTLSGVVGPDGQSPSINLSFFIHPGANFGPPERARNRGSRAKRENEPCATICWRRLPPRSAASGFRRGRRAICRDRGRGHVSRAAPISTSSSTTTTTPTYNNGEEAKFKTGYDVDAIARLQARPVPARRRGRLQARQAQEPRRQHAADHRRRNGRGHDGDGSRLQRRQPHRHQDADGQRAARRQFRRRASAAMPAAAPAVPGPITPGDSDNAWAFQGIAGLRYALTPNVDAGLKYRYFHTGKLGFDDAFTVNSVPFTTTAQGQLRFAQPARQPGLQLQRQRRGRRRSRPRLRRRHRRHRPSAAGDPDLPDGSVILATSACPAPPPPPPPPPAASGRTRPLSAISFR